MASPSDHTLHDHIWKVCEGEPLKAGAFSPIVFTVQKVQLRPPASASRNDTSRQVQTAVSLTDVVIKYTNGRLGTLPNQPGVSVLQVEALQLYDILGMLRSLQYDIELYNTTCDTTGGGDVNDATSVTPSDRSSSLQPQTNLYGRFRFNQQMLACKNTNYASSPCSANQKQAVEGLDALVEYLEALFSDRIETARDLLKQQLIDFDSLGEYCSPGTVLLDTGLLTGVSSVPTAVRCRACRYRRHKTVVGNIVSVFEAAVEFVLAMGGSKGEDYATNDGGAESDSYYAVVEAQWHQSEFEGTRSTRMFMTGSTILVEPTVEVMQLLTERGKAYQSFCSSPQHGSGSGTLVEYHPETFWPCRSGSTASTISSPTAVRPLRMGGRMMVDPVEAWSRGVHSCKPPADGMAADAILQTLQSYALHRRQQQQQQQKSSDPNKTASSSKSPDDFLLFRGPLPDCLVTLTWPVICGFSLVGRVWGVALVEGLSKVQFETKAIDGLVLPPARKRLLQALVTCHGGQRVAVGSHSSHTADVIPGKGEGLIILLHGSPGVGKTLTAEAVSEVLHRPLYRVSMGELGTTPERLEERLQEIFDLCLPWKALILIDEAEILLETRKKCTDLVRNAMVCVMLRLLEYYPGILFLTTNSDIDDLDPAVASRITCALHYDPLDLKGREEIWRSSLARISSALDSPNLVTDADLTKLATMYATTNGRQIKNAVQLASLVSLHGKIPLTMDRLCEMLELTASVQTA